MGLVTIQNGHSLRLGFIWNQTPSSESRKILIYSRNQHQICENNKDLGMLA